MSLTDMVSGRGSIPLTSDRAAPNEVQSEGGFYEEQDKQEFTLVADARGLARKE